MAIDLNMDMGDLIRALKKGKKKKSDSPMLQSTEEKEKRSLKPYMTVILLGTSLVGASAGYVTLYALPEQEKQKQMEARILELKAKKNELPMLQNQTAVLKKKLKTNMEQYDSMIEAFDDTADLDELYQSISTLGMVHQLLVENVNKKRSFDHPKHTEVAETHVEIILTGRFHDYLSFKKDLAQDRPLLHIVSERLQVGTKSNSGKLTVKLQLATYTIDKKPFEQLTKLKAEKDNTVVMGKSVEGQYVN